MSLQDLTCTHTSSSEHGAVLRLQGPINRHTVVLLLEQVAQATPSKVQQLTLDLADVSAIDSAGVASLLTIWRQVSARSITVDLVRVPAHVREQLALYTVHPDGPLSTADSPNYLESLGESVVSGLENALALLVLAADTSAELVNCVINPRRVRWRALVEQMSHIGSQGLGTVSLITFLVGLTLAFQSAHQLRQFGAAIFVANLTAVAMMREMGPLMTAILVAGRSGSAIAAEIATMKVSEELDALQIMGISFNRFLATPRVLAMLIVMPMLVIMADLVGMLGGLVVGMGYLDLSLGPYLSATLDALGSKDLTMSLSKAMVFGWGIALIGLHNGLKVREGAQEVGTATTASVVQSLFFIIVMDALFSVLFYVVL